MCIMTNFLWIKPTDALNSNFIGIMTLHVSCSLSAHHQEFLAVHRHWYILCNFDDRCYQFDDQFHPAPDSKRSSNLHKMYQCWYTAKNSWWWAERLPETCRVIIPIKLEFSATVGSIHKVQFWTLFLVLSLFNHSVSATESVFITRSMEGLVPPGLSSLERCSFCDDIRGVSGK